MAGMSVAVQWIIVATILLAVIGLVIWLVSKRRKGGGGCGCGCGCDQ